MVSPNIDEADQSFSYFSKPTDVIGRMDHREGTLITPEGYLYTGSGELMFFTGNPPKPINKRVKTLFNNKFPIIQYTYRDKGIPYKFTMFANTLTDRVDSPLINFIRVRIQNPTERKRTVYFATAIRYQNNANTDWGIGDYRFGRAIIPDTIGAFEQAGVEFNQDWLYAFKDNMLTRDGKILYQYMKDSKPSRRMTWKMGYNEQPIEKPMSLYVLPTTPVGIVQYELTLEPGETKILDFKLPYLALPKESSWASRLQEASFDEYLQKTIDFWENILTRGINISLPEKKVTNTFDANLIYDLIARDKIDSFYVQKVNEFQYDAFWLRDAAFIVRMYDISGYHEFARQCLDFFLKWQRSDGNFISQGGQYDGWGQTLWAFGQHIKMTGDKKYARKIYPYLKKAYKWMQKTLSEEPSGLMPVTTPGDNELITGHVTGHNFWALNGLKSLIFIANFLDNGDADDYQKTYDEYYQNLERRLKKVTDRTEGYIPPGLDTLGGQDWGNLLSLYPVQLLDKSDFRIRATLDRVLNKYKEGLMTYGDGRWLHHYLTMRNSQTALILGDQEQVIRDLYAVLLHTGSTHTGFEFSILPWKTRDFGMNLAPHGWFAAEYRTLLRNMLVREEGENLHLLSAVSPAWIQPGEKISIHKAATYFGSVNFELECKDGSAILTLDNNFKTEPKTIILHLPWFMEVRKVYADGNSVNKDQKKINLPAGTHKVEIQWQKQKSQNHYNYQQTVKNYKKEYQKRYNDFLQNGN
ncbi:MAG: hypothetical protein K9N00_04240 [Candidatus Marinimicrobia bacterium]|nr:hypothetical protein [Candidatus Neomarinimicrobiota bacterium]